MNYQIDSHCPDCFRESSTAICQHCQFNRDAYISQEAANHHLPLFTKLIKGDVNYVLGRVLGEGGFAIVYAAMREPDGLSFAVKEYYPESLASRGLDKCTVQAKRREETRLAQWQERFKQEAGHLRRCQDYPAIVGVVRFADMIGQHNTAYLVMERLRGNSLRTYLDAAKPPEWIIGWLRPLLDTLGQLHTRQIFHRDISPNNIFLTDGYKPVLMDFGLAREGIRDHALKSSAIGAGTEGFIAPEQTLHAANTLVDARTDMFALGALVYMALHGEPPPGVVVRLQGGQLKRYAAADDLARLVEKLALHCLQIDRDKRPKNALMIKKSYALLWQRARETIIPDPRLPFEPEMVALNGVGGARTILFSWLPLKGSRFLMGSPKTEPERCSDERQHPVDIEAFEIGKYAVTKGQFNAFVTATGYQTEAETGEGSYGCEGSYYAWSKSEWKKDKIYNWRNPGFTQDDDHPVVCVSWNDAQAYIAWLNEKSGKRYRLPTEAQWEYAARAGTTTAFYTGDCINTRQANYDGDYDYNNCGAKTGVYKKGTVAVGTYPANAWGLYDMAGNVWEWTCSVYVGDYDGSEKKCVSNNKAKTTRVLRGGSWDDGPRYLRSAYRLDYAGCYRFNIYGFRLSRM